MSSKIIDEAVNLTPDKARLSHNGKEYIIDFGDIDRSFDASVSLLLKTDREFDKNVFTSCGCTTPQFEKTPEGYLLSIKYSNTSLGSFTKTVKIKTVKGKKEEIFKIKGRTNATTRN